MGSDAVRRGTLSRHRLRAQFRAIYPDIYLPAHAARSLRTRSVAAWLWSGRRGVLAGLAAAALHGSSWIDDDEPIELIWRNPHPPAGVITRNQRLEPDEITRVAGLPVTTPARTAFDLARQRPRGEAVARLDALMRATPFSTEEVLMLAERRPRARGLRKLRAALPLVDPGAASPKETWLRLLLIDAGFRYPPRKYRSNRTGGSSPCSTWVGRIIWWPPSTTAITTAPIGGSTRATRLGCARCKNWGGSSSG